jgi:peptidoglycan/xylan/chitin deacetylase (PgdA/CDA1 family)
MMLGNKLLLSIGLLSIWGFACESTGNKNAGKEKATDSIQKVIETPKTSHDSLLPVNSNPGDVLKRKEVPILCYHQIRDWRPTDSKRAKDYIVPVAAFREQIKMLADSGYHTILPDELYAYLTSGKTLPTKPIMLTFDDTDLDQFEVALPEMKKYGYKGVFFIMTVSLGKTHYMSKDQVKQLSDLGHVIGSHTWDHHNFKKYEGKDWTIQIDKPTKELESITGKSIRYFAYPFGLWNKEGIPALKERGFLAAFQLNEKRDAQDPLFTIRRIIVPGTWSLITLRHWINTAF